MYLRLHGYCSRGRLRISNTTRIFHSSSKLSKTVAPSPKDSQEYSNPIIGDSKNTVVFLDLEDSQFSSHCHDSTCSDPTSAKFTQSNNNSHINTSKHTTHVHSQLHQLHFTSNRALDGQNLTFCQKDNLHTKPPRLSEMIYGFFKRESENLVEKIDINSKLLDEIDYSLIDPSLRLKLNNQLDNYNRFVILLNQHPLTVPCSLILRLYSLLSTIIPSDRQALLRMLVHHQSWNDFWRVALAETPTLTDIEDVTELLYSELESCNSVGLGLWCSLQAAHKNIDNVSLFLSLCECLAYRFKVELAEIENFCVVLDSKIDRNSVSLVSDPDQRTAIVLTNLQEIIDDSNVQFDQIRKYLLEHTFVFYTRGFISEVLRMMNEDAMVDFIVRRPHLKLNELDLYVLWQKCNGMLPHAGLRHLNRELQRGTRISETVKNSFMSKTQDPHIQLALTSKLYASMNSDELAVKIPLYLSTSDGIKVLKKFKKKKVVDFEKAVLIYLQNLHSDADDYSEAISGDRQLVKSNSTPNSAQVSDQRLLWLISECRHLHSPIFKEALQHLNPTVYNFEALLSLRLSAADLTEVWAFLLKNNILNDSTTVYLFQEILQKTWDYKELAHRAQSSPDSEYYDDFKELFRSATSEEHKKLIHQLQGLARALASSEAEQIARVLNCLHGALYPVVNEDSEAEQLNPCRSQIYENINANVHVNSDVYSAAGINKLSQIREVAKKPVDITASAECTENVSAGTSQVLRRVSSVPARMEQNRIIRMESEFQRPDESIDSAGMEAGCKHATRPAPRFTLFLSEGGRRYILLKIMQYTMRSMYDAEPGLGAVRRMGSVLHRLAFDSRDAQSAIYHHMVKEQPRCCIQILQNYEKKKSHLVRPLMNAIEQGILESGQLSGEQRLRLFEEFQATKTSLNYQAKPSRKTVMIWGKLAAQQPRRDEELMRQVVALAMQRRVPLKEIRNWSYTRDS